MVRFFHPRPHLQVLLGLLGALALLSGCDSATGPAPAATRVTDEAPAQWPPQETSALARTAPPITSRVGYSSPRIFRLPPPDEVEVEPAGGVDLQLPSSIDHTATDNPAIDTSTSDQEANSEPWSPAPQACEPPRPAASPQRAFTMEEYDDDAEAAASASADELSAYFTAEDELSSHFKEEVQQAFTLARHGALHAARTRFVGLLDEMARAKDAARMTSRHSRALAAGLRALEEADDFGGAGGDTKAVDLARGAGHQTPMLQEEISQWTLPHEAMAMYHRYAERKLAAAVAGEQAGSMALFGIGRIYQQLAARRDQATQPLPKALTYYRSAVLAHPRNHLAANEAGVLLARAGRYAQARPWFDHSLALSPSSTTHGNLAYVCQKLGDGGTSAVHASEATRLASHEMSTGRLSAERGITWLTPDEFNRRSSGAPIPQASPQPQIAMNPAAPPTAPPTNPAQQAQPPADPRRPTRSFWW
jgi:tetratricopeptide (TPR) repeat protein